MEYASKEFREYLRASELLLVQLHDENQCFSSFELLALKVHNERLRAAIVHIENTALLKTILEDRDRREAERES